MSRIHGRRGRLYAAIASNGTPEPIADLNKWDINFTVAYQDVTSFGDTNIVYVAGLADASGAFGGFYDDSTAQLFTAAQDGLQRSFYLYPNTSTAQYWYGPGLFDFAVQGDVGAAVTVSGNWKAAGAITKFG